MKKLAVVFLMTFAILTNSINAQIIQSYGFKLGLTNSFDDWNYKSELVNDLTTDSELGLNFAGFVEFLDLPFVSVITKIGYNQKGMEYKIKETTPEYPLGTGNIYTYSNRAGYLEMVFSLKLSYETPMITPYLFIGSGADLLINKDTSIAFESIYDDYEKMVYGLKVGTGIELAKLIPYSLLVEFQYNYNFTNVYESDNLEIDNNSLEFSLGIAF